MPGNYPFTLELKMKKIAFLIFSILLAGCTTSKTAPTFSTAESPEVKPDKAILYIFRDYAEPTAFAAYLSIDKVEAAALNQQGFTWIYIEPGKHQFTYSWNLLSGMPTVKFEGAVEGGKVYAFQMTGDVNSTSTMVRSKSAIQGINIQVAIEKMNQCCRYVPSKYRGPG